MSSSGEVALPPIDGTVTVLPGFLDFHAEHNPNASCFIFPFPDISSDETRTISFSQFAEATHRIAHAFRPRREGPEGAVVVVLVNCDTLLYHALLAGLVRAGLVPFPMSPRNSPPAVASMMERTRCRHIISQSTFAALTDAVCATLPYGDSVRVDNLPPLIDVFPSLAASVDTPAKSSGAYPSSGRISAPDDIVLYLHSSGSTGHPKPIPQTNKTLLHWCHLPLLAECRKRAIRWGCMALPAFHTMGLSAQLLAPLVSGQQTSLYPPRAIFSAPPIVPTPQNTIETARKTQCTAIESVPAFLEAWAHNEEDVKFLASLEALIFAGGPLSTANGDKLVAGGVRLFACYGATEFGTFTCVFDDDVDEPSPVGKTRADYQWLQMPKESNPRWVPQSDGTFELQLLACPTHQPSIENLPNGEHGYSTSDLFEPHSTKPGLWKIVGRTDDVIVLGSGEKVVPIPQENHISALPWVAGTIMFGRGHQQVGILVEPQPGHEIHPGDEKSLIRFRNDIWKQVEEANADAPAFSRVFKEMIIAADPDRPFVRAAKGTTQRKKTLEIYSKEIDDLLSATYLRNRIIGALRESSDASVNAATQHIQSNLVFQYPTLSALAERLEKLVGHGAASTMSQSPSSQIDAMTGKYVAQLPPPPKKIRNASSHDAVVLLTGSTGSLGAHILALLLGDARVKRVYALNRGQSIAQRQLDAFESYELPGSLLQEPKLTLLSGDFAHEDLGLDYQVLKEISDSATHIIHNAWRVDFNLALASFESHIAAAVRLLALVPEAHYIFTSSVSIAGGWHAAGGRGPVPEACLRDSKVASATSGYGMSKYVVEEVLADARKSGFKTTSLRIGQISGASETGAWNVSDWVPSIVKSSIALGAFPELDGVVSWVSMDTVANTALDVLFGPNSPELVNVVHPEPVTWREVANVISAELGDLPFTPLADWVKRLEVAAEGATSQDLQTIPGIKLLEYFRSLARLESDARESGVDEIEVGGLPIFQTSVAKQVSPTIAGLRPLGEKDARSWVNYWRKGKFLP
ncbi:hypothetical protein IEO21_05278 [Rhodonia placenta]|uniref:Acetyl-CoA synthetase-like protein n=1 Tax=Rhodonia placenta TaxID=104341 RepID=A0A8H7P2I7_9APHY|nr:hypothetical protein IEO21_05278 [Postia placenta]